MNEPSMNPQSSPDEQAMCWVVRLTAGDMQDEERRQFEEWWLGDPRHSEALAEASGFWFGFEGTLTPEIRARCVALIPKDSAVKRRAPHRFVKFAAAAALLVAVFMGWFALRNAGLLPESYATQTGQNRTVVFKDGSVAYLNTRTRIKWLGGKADRRVALLDGEAFFEVVPDASRPFRVMTGNSEIRVVGTRFNVYRKNGGEVVVTVVEGAVQVQHAAPDAQVSAWKRILRQNEQLAYGVTGTPPNVQRADARRFVKWREGAVDIKNAPLSDAVEELSRYTDRQIHADDPRLEALRVSAILPIRDAREALTRLTQLAPIAVAEGQQGFTLSYREQPALKP